MVTSAHPLASEAGLSLLKQGGNAIVVLRDGSIEGATDPCGEGMAVGY